MYRIYPAVFCLLLLMGSPVYGITTSSMQYSHEGTTLKGYLAFDETRSGPRPGVLIVHDWDGLGEYEKRRARELANLGYVAFALDVYGEGVRPETTAKSREQSGKYYGDRELYRERVKAGYEQLASHARTGDQIAVIGYCFGGAGVLELARSDVPLSGAVTFHGTLSIPGEPGPGNIQAPVLILHGGADPHVTMEDVTELRKQFERANLDYQINIYGGAYHAFTVPGAGDDPSGGVAYDKQADRRSWRDMKQFFEEIFS